MYDHLGANLKLLCSHYRSIAEVCRKLGINRAQFNKYLNGQSRPTAHNLKRICDFFGVEGYELGLPSEQFTQLVGLRRHDQERIAAGDPLLELFEPLRDNASSLSRYCGYYFEYANCLSVPGQILLSLVQVREDRGSFVFERQERQEQSRADNPGREDWVVRCRYLGAAFYLQDRLFLIDYESLTGNEMSQTILIPSFKSRINRLNGLKTGVSSGDRRTPACTRVVWEYLGSEINRVNAYRQVMLYGPDDPRIDPQIRERLASAHLRNGLFEIE
ncbi:helix-turn-helix domain-containing protein [Stutzerimonas stutzeri]|uniref:Helix-turn-helix domain-containing protein n=1 Tax=Stutzerimonas stutzeri TaxID=316 RepID=A0A6I6LIZ3_STUST|nr:helix-turn-helix transcriptional regulator [Stutzerimonas stutzeri]QGZ28940.1 helix-turn-helix domain-containing protein [Stutzerimonas stutzeri]